MATPQMPPQMQPPPPQKKTNWILWIIVAVFGLILMAGVLFGVGAYLVARKVREVAGGNPASIVKMLASMNPDAEVIRSDEGSGTVTIRDKKTGKVVTMNFDDLKNGKMVFQEDGKEAVTIHTKGGENGSVEIKTGDGVTRFGAGAGKVPAWIPTYPGSSPQGSYSTQSDTEQAGAYTFQTADAPEKVSQYYQAALKDAGFTIETTASSADSTTFRATADDGKRTVRVTISKDQTETVVAVIFSSKK